MPVRKFSGTYLSQSWEELATEKGGAATVAAWFLVCSSGSKATISSQNKDPQYLGDRVLLACRSPTRYV